MCEIIKFKPKSLEDKFMDSLTDEQMEIFEAIIVEIERDYNNLYKELQTMTKRYLDKVAECEKLRRKNEET